MCCQCVPFIPATAVTLPPADAAIPDHRDFDRPPNEPPAVSRFCVAAWRSKKRFGKETIRLICYIKSKIICFLVPVPMLPACLDPFSLGHGRDDASHQPEATCMRHSSEPSNAESKTCRLMVKGGQRVDEM